MKPTPPATLDRARVEALVREALAREQGGGAAGNAAAAREVDTAGALLLTPDRGVNVGEPYDPPVMARVLASTPARVGVGRVGPRYYTNTMLRFRADHAAAKDAVLSEVDAQLLAQLGMFEIASRAPDKATFLQRPDLGRTLSDEGRAELGKRIGRAPTLAVIYGDGLSAAAINQHLPEFHGALERALASRGITHAQPFFVRHSRVKIMDEIARLVGAQAALFVCGERPGLGFADSLSAYYIYQPAAGATDADREVISNINPRGRPPADAAGDVAAAIERILREKKSGVMIHPTRADPRGDPGLAR
jgi:ethanolamine ammonia-lyase small subunit